MTTANAQSITVDKAQEIVSINNRLKEIIKYRRFKEPLTGFLISPTFGGTGVDLNSVWLETDERDAVLKFYESYLTNKLVTLGVNPK